MQQKEFEKELKTWKKENEALQRKLNREQLENRDAMSIRKRDDGKYDITILLTRFNSTIEDVKKCCAPDEKGHDQYLISEELLNRTAEYVRHVYEVFRKSGYIRFE